MYWPSILTTIIIILRTKIYNIFVRKWTAWLICQFIVCLPVQYIIGGYLSSSSPNLDRLHRQNLRVWWKWSPADLTHGTFFYKQWITTFGRKTWRAGTTTCVWRLITTTKPRPKLWNSSERKPYMWILSSPRMPSGMSGGSGWSSSTWRCRDGWYHSLVTSRLVEKTFPSSFVELVSTSNRLGGWTISWHCLIELQSYFE